jgi:hypothetical protein
MAAFIPASLGSFQKNQEQLLRFLFAIAAL